MLHHFLVPYQVTLNCKNIDAAKGTPVLLEDVLKKYFSRKEKVYIKTEKYLNLSKFKKFENHSCYGTMKYGEFGFEAELTDTITGEIKAKQTTKDAQTMPFFFRIKCNNPKTATIVFQKIGILGIKTAFENDLKEFCLRHYSDYSISFVMQAKKDVANKFFKASTIKTISFTTRSIPKEVENSLSDKEKKLFQAEIRIKKPSIVSKLISNLGSWKTYNGSKIEKTRVKTKLGDRSATFTLGNIENTDIALVLENRIVDVDTGHPYFEKINEEAKALIDNIK